MSPTEDFLVALQAKLNEQGLRVLDLLLMAVDCCFERNPSKAEQVISGDDTIDRIDVEIERDSIEVLSRGIQDAHQIRQVLTIVKVNNELERIADGAVNVAEVVIEHQDEMAEDIPPTFRVMANSVIGMLRDTIRAMEESNTFLAEQVLSFDDTVDKFKQEIGLDAERKVSTNDMSVGFAFRLRTVTAQLERIADHCTNVCEQLIYLQTGKIVRHRSSGWTQPEPPMV
jgi:phosphate transport system protein